MNINLRNFIMQKLFIDNEVLVLSKVLKLTYFKFSFIYT